MKNMRNIKRQDEFCGVGVGVLLLAVFGGISIGTDGKKKDQHEFAYKETVKIARSVDETY